MSKLLVPKSVVETTLVKLLHGKPAYDAASRADEVLQSLVGSDLVVWISDDGSHIFFSTGDWTDPDMVDMIADKLKDIPGVKEVKSAPEAGDPGPGDLGGASVAHQIYPYNKRRTIQTESLLHEYSYKDLMKGIDWDFINMRGHYNDARKRGVNYVRYNAANPRSGSNGQYIFFKTPLSPRSKRRGYRQDAWYQTIRLMDFEEAMRTEDARLRDKVNLAISGDLQVHCTCPAFNFWGYRYIVTQLDTAVYDQPITPDVRNPNRRGVVCKHLALVLKVLPFWMADITGDLRRQGFDQPPTKPAEEPTEETPEEPENAER